MNYIKELNAFKDWLLLHEIPSGAIVLWYTLMSINNATGWKKEFNAPNSVVRKLSGLSKQGLLNARKRLIDHERIRCKKGKKGQAPIYEMVPFVGREVPPTSFSITPSSSRSDVPIDDASITRHDGHLEGQVHPDSQLMDSTSPYSDVQTIDPSSSRANNSIDDSYPSQSEAAKSDLSTDYSNAVSQDVSSTDSDTGSWSIPKQKQKKKRDSSRVRPSSDPLLMFEQNIGKLRPITADLLKAWCIERSDAVVQAAIELATKRGGRTFRYVEAILREWAQADITTVEAVAAYEAKKRPQFRDLNTIPFRGQETHEEATIFDELRQEEA